MARRSQNFEGVANGTAFTLANTTGGGYPVVTYRSNANSNTVASTSVTPGFSQGSVCALATAQSGVITTATMAAFGVKAEGTATLVWLEVGATLSIAQIRNSTTRVVTASQTAGKVKFSSNSADRYTTPNAVTARGLYWIEQIYDVGTTTADGKFKVAVRDLAGAFALGMTDYQEFTGQNTGGGTMPSEYRAGAAGTEATVRTVQIERMETVDSYTSAMPTSTPPTADAGPDHVDVEPYSTVQLDGTASQAGSSAITSFSWGAPSPAGPTLVNPTSATPTLYVPATVVGQTYTVPLTVSDGTLTSSDSVAVTVLPATDTRWLADGTEVPFEWTSL